MARSTLVERMDAAGIVIPDSATVAGLGGIALAEGTDLEGQTGTTRPSLGLTPFHDCLLLVASVGATTEEAAEVFSCETADITKARDEINDASGVKTMAASVSLGIKQGIVPIQVSSKRYHVNNLRLAIIQNTADGRTNHEIGRNVLGMRRDKTVRIIMGLWHNLGASGRTEGVRRAYEVELVHQPGKKETMRLTPPMRQFLRDQAAVRQTALASQSPDQQSE